MHTWLSGALGLGPVGDRDVRLEWAGVSPAGPTALLLLLNNPRQASSTLHPFLTRETEGAEAS